MTRAHKQTAGILVVTMLAAVTVSVLLMIPRPSAPSLSLVFERYSTKSDLFVQDMAFLTITNCSARTCYLGMGATNTDLPDTVIGFGRPPSDRSRLVICEFRDRPHGGITNPTPPVSWVGLGECIGLAPHSATRLRVPLPPAGQKRKVAVLYLEYEPSIRPFWTHGIGLTLLRILPRSTSRNVIVKQPALLRVWCEHELAHETETPETQ